MLGMGEQVRIADPATPSPRTTAGIRAAVGWIGLLNLVAMALTAPIAAQEPKLIAASRDGIQTGESNAGASGQGLLASFDQLASRVRVGDTLWVTDVDGRETRGRLQRLTTTSLTLNAKDSKLFDAQAISSIRNRQRDTLKNGALIGLVVGSGMATAWCIGALADDSGDLDPAVECAEGFIFAGLGTLIGLTVDAIVPGKRAVIYRASGAPATASARQSISVVPVIGPHRFMLVGVVRRRAASVEPWD